MSQQVDELKKALYKSKHINESMKTEIRRLKQEIVTLTLIK